MINLLIYINEPCVLSEGNVRHQRPLDVIYDKKLVRGIEAPCRGSLCVSVIGTV